MDVTNIEGCCVVSNLYNLGGAHSVLRHKNQREFNNALRDKMRVLNRHIVCYTNFQQNVERKFLETAGFTVENFGTICMHKITKENLQAYLNNSLAQDRLSEQEEINSVIAEINQAVNSPFRAPKPPYTLEHWKNFLLIVGNTQHVRDYGAHYNHQIYNDKLHKYQYLASTLNGQPLPRREFIEAYFKVKIGGDYNLGSTYLLCVPEINGYNKTNCLLNYINHQHGCQLNEYK